MELCDGALFLEESEFMSRHSFKRSRNRKFVSDKTADFLASLKVGDRVLRLDGFLDEAPEIDCFITDIESCSSRWSHDPICGACIGKIEFDGSHEYTCILSGNGDSLIIRKLDNEFLKEMEFKI